jgi:hypothetical protein
MAKGLYGTGRQHAYDREARGSWSQRDKGLAYHPLPYDYRSRSHRYASSKEWSSHERYGERPSPMHEHEHGYGYAEEYRYKDRPGAHGPYDSANSEYQEGNSGSDYGEDAPAEVPGGEPWASGGATTGTYGTMSINAPEALDSWHGYGVDCPDRA